MSPFFREHTVSCQQNAIDPKIHGLLFIGRIIFFVGVVGIIIRFIGLLRGRRWWDIVDLFIFATFALLAVAIIIHLFCSVGCRRCGGGWLLLLCYIFVWWFAIFFIAVLTIWEFTRLEIKNIFLERYSWDNMLPWTMKSWYFKRLITHVRTFPLFSLALSFLPLKNHLTIQATTIFLSCGS